jgi:hypothetical protein
VLGRASELCLLSRPNAFFRRMPLLGPSLPQVFLNAASVCVVSAAALTGPNEGQVLKGIGFIGAGCFVMACQLVLEEVKIPRQFVDRTAGSS